MPIQFTCPHCGNDTEVSDNYAGQSGPCAQCGKTITIPLPGVPADYAVPTKSSSAVPVVVIVVVAVVGVVVVCGGILVALLLPAISSWGAARRAQCLNNLKQIGLGFQNSESALKRFPSAYGAEQQGRPKSSWRVHLLRYMESAALYDRYDFDQPWDSPNNRVLMTAMPPLYRCPSDPNSSMSETSYVAIVGPETAMPAGGKVGMRDIQDGASGTILVVDVHNSGITWTEPRDLDAETLNYRINAPGGSDLQGTHAGGINVLFGDGAVRFLHESVDPEVLKAMTTRSGGEPPGDVFY